jgi:hypothetical protein
MKCCGNRLLSRRDSMLGGRTCRNCGCFYPDGVEVEASPKESASIHPKLLNWATRLRGLSATIDLGASPNQVALIASLLRDLAKEIEDVKLLVIRCNLCFAVLEEPGELRFTAPDSTGQCFKIHVCAVCAKKDQAR